MICPLRLLMRIAVLVMKAGQLQDFAPQAMFLLNNKSSKFFDAKTVIDEHPMTQRPTVFFLPHTKQD